MATSLNYDVSTDALPSEENYRPNTVSRAYREQHLPQANGENSSFEEKESASLNAFLEQSDNRSAPSSFAEYLEPSNDTSVVGDCYPSRGMASAEGYSKPSKEMPSREDEDDKIYRFLLELTATCGLKWAPFLADLGYSSRELLQLPVEKRDNYFCRYLKFWLETVTRLGQNPVTYLFRALKETQHKDLVDKFKLQFDISGCLSSPSICQFDLVKRNLSQIDIPNQPVDLLEEKDTSTAIICVEKEIWRNLTDRELQEIKAYLGETKKKKFGKRVLEEIKTGVDLMRKLHETCLVNEDDFDYLKSILNFLKRDDLIKKITELERLIAIRKHETIPVGVRRKSPPYIDAGPPSTKIQQLKHECKQQEDLVLKFPNSTRIIEQHIATTTKHVLETDFKVKELTDQSDSCRRKKEEFEKQRMQIEESIKKLRSEADILQAKEKSVGQEDITVNTEKEATKKLNKKYRADLERLRNTLDKENDSKMKHTEKLEHIKQELEKEIEQIIEKDGPCPIDEETNPFVRYESHISIDTEVKVKPETEEKPVQIGSYNASAEEAAAKLLPPDLSVKPTILVMAAEENKDDLESFKSEVLLAVPQSLASSSIQEIVIESNITGEFLRTTDNHIQKSGLLFILVSGGFAKRCWPDISKMKNLTAALYDQQPLVVPVIIKANIKPPMGLNSAHSLSFYRRDSYYKEALSKLLGQFK